MLRLPGLSSSGLGGDLEDAYQALADCMIKRGQCRKEAERLVKVLDKYFEDAKGMTGILGSQLGRAAMACFAGAYALAVLAGYENAKTRMIEALRLSRK